MSTQDKSSETSGLRLRLDRGLPLWGQRVWPWVTFGAMCIILLGYLGSTPSAVLDALFSPADEMGYYQRLAEAILDGRAHLKTAPPSWLLTASNPYDPETSFPVRAIHGLGDAILFDGRFWYYWQPGVVFFLVAPLLAIGLQIGEPQVGFASLVVIAACGVDMAVIVQRARRAGRGISILLALALGLPYSAIFLVSRISIWESNVLAAAALVAVALQCFIRYWAGIPGSSQRTLVIGCVAGGLATTIRLEGAIVFLVPIAQFALSHVSVFEIRRIKPQAIVGSLFSLTLGISLALAYNFWRFGDPLDFKTDKMLTGYEDQSKVVLSSIEYLLPNAYYYLARPIGLLTEFPILNFGDFKWPFPLPLDYSEIEPAVGAVWVMPWAIVGLMPLIAIILVSGARPSVRTLLDGRFATFSLLLLTACALLLIFLSISILSATQRYHLLPAVLLGVSCAAALAAVPGLFAGTPTGRLFRSVVAILLLWSVALSLVGGSQGYYPPESDGNPDPQTISGKVSSTIAEGVTERLPFFSP